MSNMTQNPNQQLYIKALRQLEAAQVSVNALQKITLDQAAEIAYLTVKLANAKLPTLPPPAQPGGDVGFVAPPDHPFPASSTTAFDFIDPAEAAKDVKALKHAPQARKQASKTS